MFLSIAIIRRNGLGDVLCGIPLVLLCKQQNPGAKVTLFVDERAKALVPYLEGPDEIVVISEHQSKYWGHFKTVWEHRKKKFDLAISAKSSPMKLMNFFLYGLQADRRMAYVDASWHSKLINCPTPHHPEEQKHQALKTLNLLDPSLSQVPTELYPRLKVSSVFQFNRPALLISVTNNRVGSTLDQEKYWRLLNGLYEKKPFNVVVNGEPKDLEKATELAAGLKMPSQVVMTEKLDDFLKLLASVDAAFIGDGGIMHLAAALNKRQLVLFGGTEVWEWAPLSDKAICLADEHNVNFIPEDQILRALHELW